jgi:hypothetical protein
VNTREIDIVNPWNHQLVGDRQLPGGERRTSLSLGTLKPNAALQPAGLLGSVVIKTTRTLKLPPIP